MATATTTKKKKVPLTNRKPATKKGENDISSKKIFEIPVNKIEIEEGFNQRIDYGTDDFEQLKGSIKKKGVEEPIRVIPHPTKKDHFYLREGHRRMKAVELINKATGGQIKKVIAMIAKKETLEESLLRMISANSGKKLSDIENGFICEKLQNYKWAVADIAEHSGLPLNKVYYCISLAKLPKKYHLPIATGEISGGLLTNLFRKFKDNPTKAEKAIEDAIKRADKEEKRNTKNGKVSTKEKHAKVTSKHFKNVGSTTDRQKIFNALKMADKHPDLYNQNKVLIVNTLYELLDTKGTEQDIANMMKK